MSKFERTAKIQARVNYGEHIHPHEVRWLLAQLEAARADAEHADKELEVYGRFAEKFGDLSCCYDAEDVTAVIKTAFDDLQADRDRLAAEAGQRKKLARENDAYALRLREALEKIASCQPIIDGDCPSIARATLGGKK